MNLSRRRKRGVILTSEGYRRWQEAKAIFEVQESWGRRYSLAALSDRVGLAQRTIVKVLDREVGMDRGTLEQLFRAFGLQLLHSDYSVANVREDQQPTKFVQTRVDWGEATEVQAFFGRPDELQWLEQWLVTDCCQLILLFGIGGIGKTSLARKTVENLESHFDFLIWRSLHHAPLVGDLLCQLVQFVGANQDLEMPESLEEKLKRLIHFLREHHCLIILDNAESVLGSGERSGQFREGYEDYEWLLRQLGELPHGSTVLMTSREKPRVIERLENSGAKVRSLQIDGLDTPEMLQIIASRGLNVQLTEPWQVLIDYYSGNPLALKMAAATVLNLFSGDVSAFLKQGVVVFGDIRELLAEQLNGLSDFEAEIMFWLAINRLPNSLADLQIDILAHVSKPELLESLESLVRRSLVERSHSRFTLQPVVMEYLSDQLVKQTCNELENQQIGCLNRYALIKAQGADHIQGIQVRLFITPILQKLTSMFGTVKGVEQHLIKMIDRVRVAGSPSGYAGGGLINMLRQLRGDLSHYNFSQITIWQADLRGVNLHSTSFAGANFERSAFTKVISNISAVAFSPDSQQLATGDGNGSVCVWDAGTGEQLSLYQGHIGWVWSVRFSPDGGLLASAGADRCIRIWDVATGKCLKVLQEHSNWVLCVAFSPDGSKLATSSLDQNVLLWSTETWKCLQIFQGHAGGIWSVAFSPDGQTLATGGFDATIRLWQVANGHAYSSLTGHCGWIYSVAFSPDGKLLASGGADKTVRLWEISSSSCLKVLTGHSDWVRSVNFSPDGMSLATSSHDTSVRLWNVDQGYCYKTLLGHTNWVISTAFSLDGQSLASGSTDQTVRLWEIDGGHCRIAIQGFTNWVWSVALSPDSQYLVTGGSDRAAHLWVVKTGLCLLSLRGHSNWVKGVAFSACGELVATGSTDQTVRLWDVASGQCRRVLIGHTSWIWSVAFAPDSTVLASGSSDQTVRLWDVATGQNLLVLSGHEDWVHSVKFSPDGQTVLSSSVDRTVRVWKTSTGECLHILRGHSNVVRSAIFSHDGHWIASASQDATVRLWNTKTGECTSIFTESFFHGRSGGIWAVAFSPDNQTLATGSEDGLLRLWNIAQGTCFATLAGHSNPIWSLVYSLNGNTIVTGSQDGTARIWNVQEQICQNTLRSVRPYEGMDITDVGGLHELEKANLHLLGAVIR